MYSFLVKDTIKSGQISDFCKGCKLWVWHADKIPPHIGFSINGAYYSLKVKGKDSGIPVERIVDLIAKKGCSTLVFELKLSLTKNQVDIVFSRYDKAASDTATCLTPIKEIIDENMEVEKLADLLHILSQNHALGKVFSLNLDDDYQGIPAYSKREIENRLNELQNVERKNSRA
jgi:hypothetical protein